MREIHKNLKFVAIATKDATIQRETIIFVEKILQKKGIEILLENSAATALNKKGYTHGEILKKSPLVLSIGGDGNYIATCRKFANSDAAVFGVHTGHLGFLTDAVLGEFEGFLGEFLSGRYNLERVFLLEAIFKNNEKIAKKLAFNDVVLMRKKAGAISHIDAFLDGKNFNSYYGDGVIISSAMGSTAYNMSAGGAIINPLCKVFSLTPICSHSLTQRPLILPKGYKIEFKSKDDLVILIDGQEMEFMKNYTSVSVGISDICVNLVRRVDRDYFAILKEKLRWGHGE